MRRFFFGCAQREPKVFQGGNGKLVVACNDQFPISPQENIWVWLRQSLEKIAHSGDNFRFSSDLVAFYAKARTYFERKG
jgi:hypothetical protein